MESNIEYGLLGFLVWIHEIGLYGTTLDIRISGLAFDISRVLLGFHHNPRFLENRVGKTQNSTR